VASAAVSQKSGHGSNLVNENCRLFVTIDPSGGTRPSADGIPKSPNRPMKKLLVGFAAMLLLGAGAEARAAALDVPEPVFTSLLQQAPGLRGEVLRLAIDAAQHAAARGLVARRDVLTVIDYSLPSSQPRLFVFDLAQHKLLFRELVAHGKNSGGNVANFFSNSPGSLATSLGLFVTADTYVGSNGYSLRLKGLEEGINDMAWDRAIVMHGAAYVSREAIKALGRLGRSWGCPAVRADIAPKLIDTLRGGSPVFAYYPEKSWLSKSAFFAR
jgi:hypothetical protein